MNKIRALNRAILNFIVNIIKSTLLNQYRKRQLERMNQQKKVTKDLLNRNKAAFFIQKSFRKFQNRKNYRNNIILTKLHWEHIARMAVKMIHKAFRIFKFRKTLKSAASYARLYRLSVMMIQRNWRNFINKRNFKNRRAYLINQRIKALRHQAALTIQRNFKMHRCILKYKKMKMKKQELIEIQKQHSVVQVQRYWRKLRL